MFDIGWSEQKAAQKKIERLQKEKQLLAKLDLEEARKRRESEEGKGGTVAKAKQPTEEKERKEGGVRRGDARATEPELASDLAKLRAIQQLSLSNIKVGNRTTPNPNPLTP
jgi:hypothetical protein